MQFVSVIIPTRNRSYLLEKTLPSYCTQACVNELIIIDDASNDETQDCISKLKKQFPQLLIQVFKNQQRLGAAKARNQGVLLATNDYIFFGEDDAFLQADYVKCCLTRLVSDKTIGAVSGRLVLMQPKEEPAKALERFGDGQIGVMPFDCDAFTHQPAAYFTEEVQLPFTHSMLVTRKKLLECHPYDDFFSKGNGYREESTFQAKLVAKGYHILVTNKTHCFHLHEKDTQIGGQRMAWWKKYFWNLYYSFYFFKKYYEGFTEAFDLPNGYRRAFWRYFCAIQREYGQAVYLGLKKRIKNIYFYRVCHAVDN